MGEGHRPESEYHRAVIGRVERSIESGSGSPSLGRGYVFGRVFRGLYFRESLELPGIGVLVAFAIFLLALVALIVRLREISQLSPRFECALRGLGWDKGGTRTENATPRNRT